MRATARKWIHAKFMTSGAQACAFSWNLSIALRWNQDRRYKAVYRTRAHSGPALCGPRLESGYMQSLWLQEPRHVLFPGILTISKFEHRLKKVKFQAFQRCPQLAERCSVWGAFHIQILFAVGLFGQSGDCGQTGAFRSLSLFTPAFLSVTFTCQASSSVYQSSKPSVVL